MAPPTTNSQPASVSRPRGAILPVLVLLSALLALLCFGWGCSRPGASSVNLLSGRAPSRSEGVLRTERLTDEKSAATGDSWNTGVTAVFVSSRAFVEYDLGREVPITAAWLQGDNNDTYVVSISDDGKSYRSLWRAAPVNESGLRARFTDTLNDKGRFIRVDVEGGDGSFGLSEVQLFEAKPAVFPPPLVVQRARPPAESFRTHLLIFAAALGVALFASRDKARWLTLAALAPAVVAGVFAALALRDAWPVGARELALLRGTVAVVGILALLREVWSPPRFMASRPVVIGVLGVCAALSLASFWNLGRPQFPDRKTGDRVFVHTADMRVYYPVAKYWKELRYDGLYMASVAAFVDDDRGVTLESLGRTPLRSLSTHRVQTVSEVKDQIANIHTRFTPERWELFKTDMRYFRKTMGVQDYLGTMTDHGANATPVWMAIAHVLFMWTTANDTTLTIGGLLDPLLLLITFIAIGRAFGIRTMLVSMIVFGANDFYMFGTNWGGATLRHDWMAYLGLGACALKKEKWALGGALLMFAASIRAFPAFALIATAFPVLWWFVDHLRTHRRLPSWAAFRESQRPWIRIVLGAVAFGVVAWLVSSLAMSFSSWPAWSYKVYLLNRDPHVNHVSLRAFLAGADGEFPAVLASRYLLLGLGVAMFALLTLVASRGKHLAQAAMAGLILVPTVLHPANYYAHLVFLLPLVVLEVRKDNGAGAHWPLRPGDAAVWIALLAMCAGQFWTTLTPSLELHFYTASALLMAALAAMLLAVLAKDFNLGAQEPAALPEGE